MKFGIHIHETKLQTGIKYRSVTVEKCICNIVILAWRVYYKQNRRNEKRNNLTIRIGFGTSINDTKL